jgi:hypothetical protein
MVPNTDFVAGLQDAEISMKIFMTSSLKLVTLVVHQVTLQLTQEI